MGSVKFNYQSNCHDGGNWKAVLPLGDWRPHRCPCQELGVSAAIKNKESYLKLFQMIQGRFQWGQKKRWSNYPTFTRSAINSDLECLLLNPRKLFYVEEWGTKCRWKICRKHRKTKISIFIVKCVQILLRMKCTYLFFFVLKPAWGACCRSESGFHWCCGSTFATIKSRSHFKKLSTAKSKQCSNLCF